jgi:hypothetical protein
MEPKALNSRMKMRMMLAGTMTSSRFVARR